MLCADAKRQVVTSGNRAAKRNAARERVVVADRELHSRIPCARCLRAANIDETSQGIRAVTSALRAAQHFDLLHVEERCDCANAAEIDVVDQETHRRIGRALVLLEFTHAANL